LIHSILSLIFIASLPIPQNAEGQTRPAKTFRRRLMPAPLDGGLRMKDYWVWCGSVVKGEDGRFHMFASRWPRGLSFGPHWLTNSEIVRAVSDQPEGPYVFQEVVLPPRGAQYWDGRMTHNPAVCKYKNQILLFYTGTTYQGETPTPDHPTTEDSALKLDAHRHERVGVAIANSVYGPWKRLDKPILDVRPGTWEQYLISNPAPFVTPEGKIMLYYKGVEKLRTHAIGLAAADDPEGPYVRLTDKPFDIGISAEDPTIWYENGQYRALMLDTGMKYSDKEIIYAVSKDGLHWEAEPNPVAISRNILWEDGIVRRMASTERPSVLVQNGKSTHAFFATGETAKGRRSSWNMVIPLKPESETGDPLDWWRDAKFGMFIHWGLYSIPGGIWNGKPLTDYRFPNPYCEHIMRLNRIPIAEYAPLAGRFNPVRFDVALIARLAKKAGMKYVVLTAKHHDGFAMFQSKTDSFNIVDGTPYQKDAVRALAEACRSQSLRFGVYYSLGRDWHDPDAFSRQTNDWDFPDSTKRDYRRYLDQKVKPQLAELLAQVGPLDVLWFDTPEQTTLKQSIELELFVNRLQPDCIVNTRIGNNVGDYEEMGDNRIPEQGVKTDWETPATMAESWGYSILDTKEYWKSPDELIRKLVDIASKGGNYLLNIGPDGEGAVPAPAVERLNAIGRWMELNGEAIIGTSASRMRKPDWGRYTQKGATIYAHVFEWPEEKTIIVPLLAEKVSSVELLTAKGAKPVRFRPTYGTGIILDLSMSAPDKNVSVLRINLN
jgi:alpha-L-fucosidase